MTITVTKLADRYLLAQVAELTLVFAAAQVTEIIRVNNSKVLQLPFYPDPVAGLVNHDGQLLPLVLAHSLLQQVPPRKREIWTAIWLQHQDGNFGIIIDRALGSTTKQQLPPTLFTEHQVDSLVLMTTQLLPSQIWQPQQ